MPFTMIGTNIGPFLGHPSGQKGLKVAHFPTNGDQNLQIWSDMLFSMTIRWWCPFLSYQNIGPFLELPRGQKGGKKSEKLPISL